MRKSLFVATGGALPSVGGAEHPSGPTDRTSLSGRSAAGARTASRRPALPWTVIGGISLLLVLVHIPVGSAAPAGGPPVRDPGATACVQQVVADPRAGAPAVGERC